MTERTKDALHAAVDAATKKIEDATKSRTISSADLERIGEAVEIIKNACKVKHLYHMMGKEHAPPMAHHSVYSRSGTVMPPASAS